MPNDPGAQPAAHAAREEHAAATLAARDGHQELAPTGLRKLCPRCDRAGWVLQRRDGAFIIVWDGPATSRVIFGGGGRSEADIDGSVSGSELVDPGFGCGFDG
jgi:hypothetical protein